MGFKTAKTKRSFTYSAVILLVISIFILTYWYYFIPSNRKTIHKNGFLILQTIAGNINDLSSIRKSLFSNFYENALSKTNRNPQLTTKRESIIDSLLKDNKLLNAKVKVRKMKVVDKAADDIRVEDGKLLVSIIDDRLKEKAEFSEDITPLLESILSTKRSELFKSYLLGKMNDSITELLYYDKDLAVRSDKGIDSLLPKGEEAYLTGIRELNLHDVSQKVFFYPFRLYQTQLMICGFVDTKEYNTALRKVPFYFLYPLVITFLLLLVLLPIIKFYVMDPNEQVRVNDVVLFGMSVFTGAALITLTIIHYYLWKGEEYRVRQNLCTLSKQIAKSFTDEIKRSYEQLTILDKYKIDLRLKTKKQSDYSNTIRNFVRVSAPASYFYFDRISWVDSSGDQKIKADLYSKPVFTNVSKRKYFDVFKKGAPYSLPGDREKKIGMEPIYSITNADFNITISKKDTMPGGYIVALAIQPNSVINSILPAGYGFCIIDEQGNVQVHSDKNRNLNENFFEKIEPASDISSAVITRQEKEINDVVAYGKTHQMLVLPLENMPFYLITFYDKGFIVPVNMRILIFALAFCFLSSLTCMALWWIMTPKYRAMHQLVFCKLDTISWLIPRPAEGSFYFHAFWFVLMYLVVLMGYVFYHNHYDISNFSILMFLILTPVNIAISLSTMRTSFIKPLKDNNLKERIPVFINVGIHLIISLFIYYATYKKFPITIGFLLYQFAINALLWMYALTKSSSRLFEIGSGRSFLNWYDRLATIMVLVLAVLPSAMFTWYAHNQEIIQSVKRQQLHLAHAVSDRSYVLQEMKGVKSTSIPMPPHYLDSLQLQNGIYTIYTDSVEYKDSIVTNQKEENKYDSFYFSIAEKVSNPYYKQQPYAALTNVADDSSWYWQRQGSNIYFNYYTTLPALKRQTNTPEKKILTIRSKLPPRFIFLNSPESLIPLLVMVGLLIYALFAWLRINLHQIFLIKHIYGKKDPPLSFSAFTNDTIYPNQQKLYQMEEEIVDDINNKEDKYDEIWKNCTEKEKFLLYNMARDGLINYKNTMEIISLIKMDLLIIDKERIKPFSRGFRAYILSVCTEDNADMVRIQKKYLENSSWQLIRMPLMILLIGIAVIIFFTQQYIFDKLLILAGGISTLAPLIISVLGGSKQQPGPKTSGS